jgi:hypothetical protein
MDDFHEARRDATIAGALVALAAGLLVLWTSGLLIALGIGTIILGIVLSITVVGAIVGVPLILVGALALIAGVVSGIGGIPFAILCGVGVGYLYYRSKLRALTRASGLPRAS